MTNHSPDIILFSYPGSPWGNKVATYLQLRGLPYRVCQQPMVWPRPDLLSLGIGYRRIPVLAIGRDFYFDTRLILEKLEKLFPRNALGSAIGSDRALEKLLQDWAELSLLKSAPSAFPLDIPLLNDQALQIDRMNLWGLDLSIEARSNTRPSAIADMRLHYELLEDMLQDGRRWILKTESPGLADIHACFLLDWINSVPDALPEQFFSSTEYPFTIEYLKRYQATIQSAKSCTSIVEVSGQDVIEDVLKGSFTEVSAEVLEDPTGLSRDQHVKVYRNDDRTSATKHFDQGLLRGLTKHEIIISSETPSGVELRLHYPRWQFTISPVSA